MKQVSNLVAMKIDGVQFMMSVTVSFMNEISRIKVS